MSATLCNSTLQRPATHCNTLQTCIRNGQRVVTTHCNTLHCNTLQHTATHGNTPHMHQQRVTPSPHTATHCQKLQRLITASLMHLRMQFTQSNFFFFALQKSTIQNILFCIAKKQNCNIHIGKLCFTYRSYCVNFSGKLCCAHTYVNVCFYAHKYICTE